MRQDVRQELDALGLTSIRGYSPGSNRHVSAEVIAAEIARADRAVRAGRAFPCVNLDGDLGPVRNFVVAAAQKTFFGLRLSTHRPLGWLLAKLAQVVA